MITFEKEVIDSAVSRLVKGDDYRDEVVNAINVSFLDFAVDFFKKIVAVKIQENNVDLVWYKKHFIAADNISPDDKAIFADINKKTITNMRGSATKKIAIRGGAWSSIGKKVEKPLY
nr:CfrBI family restriction endonuclease [Candidatus Endomicrobium trichonymphae]